MFFSVSYEELLFSPEYIHIKLPVKLHIVINHTSIFLHEHETLLPYPIFSVPCLLFVIHVKFPEKKFFSLHPFLFLIIKLCSWYLRRYLLKYDHKWWHWGLLLIFCKLWYFNYFLDLLIVSFRISAFRTDFVVGSLK